HAKKRVVHHTVAERRRPDLPALWIADPEAVERPPRIRAALQLVAELAEPGFQVVFELPHLGAVALPVARADERSLQVVEGDDAREEVLLSRQGRRKAAGPAVGHPRAPTGRTRPAGYSARPAVGATPGTGALSSRWHGHRLREGGASRPPGERRPGLG